MSYRKPPILDEDEEKEFAKYEEAYYVKMLSRSETIYKMFNTPRLDSNFEALAILRIFDKLASPRVYLVEKWLKERARKEAGVTE